MDRYTKVILTVIAVLLAVTAFHSSFRPALIAHADDKPDCCRMYTYGYAKSNTLDTTVKDSIGDYIERSHKAGWTVTGIYGPFQQSQGGNTYVLTYVKSTASPL